MATGTVAYFDNDGGYGFIETDATDEDVFFHMADLDGPDAEEGEDLEFDIERAEKGPRARNIQRP
jgi:CspA family cold shock protein